MGLFSNGVDLKKDPHAISIAGKGLRCPHCGGERFVEREMMLNTSLMTLADLDWMEPSALAFICPSCGCMQSFLRPVDLERDLNDA